jgi:hypothetical protein
MLVLKVLGNQGLDAQAERLRSRVSEDGGGHLIPEDYLLGFCLRDDNRISDLLKEPADS